MYYKTVIETEIFTFLNTNQHFSPNSRVLYKVQLTNFFLWAAGEGYEPSTINPTTVNEYLYHTNWAKGTRYVITVAIRAFYRYKYGANHPVANIKTQRLDPGPQRTLSENELVRLLTSVDTTTIQGIRDLSIITLLADTGLRVSEIANLEVKNVHVSEMRLDAFVKGGKWAEKVFFDYSASCLYSWIQAREKTTLKDSKFLYGSVSRRKNPGRPLTRAAIGYRLELYSKQAGLENVTPHSLRRTFATLAIENGAPTRLVQRAGGWSSIEMVERYTRKINAAKLRKFSPINNAMGFYPDAVEVQRIRTGRDFEDDYEA
jgi:integrase/recombinase XerD